MGIAHLDEMRSGWYATKMMMALRWRMIRERKTRVIISVSGMFILIGIFASINIGYAIELSIREQAGAANAPYRDALLQVLKGAHGNIGSVFLLSVFAMAIFAPLAGTATISLLPAEDLQSIRPSNTHRYFDSLVINSISGIGILQLLTLTCLSSILSINGPRIFPMLFVWSLWILLIELTTTLGWLLEWVTRRFGKAKRRILGSSLFLIASGLFGISLYFGISPYGFGNFTLSRLLETVHGRNLHVLVNLGLIWAMILGLLVLGSVLSKRALLYAAPATAKGAYHKSGKLTKSISIITFRLVLTIVWRTREARRPILVLLIFGIPAMAFSHLDSNKLLELMIAIPLTVSLSWAVNLFGILGTGMNWLGSQPKIMKMLPLAAFLIQAAIDWILLGLLWVTAFLAGNASVTSGIFLLKSASIIIFGTSALSTYLSINYPTRAQIAGRGNAIIPPLTALGYLLQLLVVAGVPTFLLVVALPNVLRYGALGIIVMLEVILLSVQNRKWGDEQIRSRIIQIVSA